MKLVPCLWPLALAAPSLALGQDLAQPPFEIERPVESAPASTSDGIPNPEQASAPQAPQEASGSNSLDTIPVQVESEAAAEPEARAKSTNRLIEEVVVTAQKREENLQDVPISVTAFSAETLDAKGVLNAQDLPLVTPGLTLSTSVNFLTVFIRGVGSDAFLVADPSVANYVDGIYLPFSNGAIQDFGAVERIEVLKGPQGTLFGRNAVGGAINVITKAPSLAHFEGSAQSSYGDYDSFANRLYVSTPIITDTLAASVSGIFNQADNYIKGTAGGEPLQKDKTRGVRLKVRWSPATWIDGTLAYLDIKTSGAGSDYAPNAEPSPLGRALGIQAQDPYAGAENEDIHFSSRNKTAYGQINLFPGPVDVRLIAGHQDIASLSNYDFDGSPLPLLFFQIEPGSAKVDSGELQVLSNNDTPGPENFRWITGAYWFHSVAGFPHGFARAAATDLDAGTVLGIPLPADLLDSLNGVLGALPTGQIDFVGTLDTKSVSFFAQGTYDFTDWAAMTVGARLQRDKRYIIQSSAGVRQGNGSVIYSQYYSADADRAGCAQALLGTCGSQWSDSKTSFKPKVSLDFRPQWDWLGQEPLLYISWQEAIKGSSFNVVNLTDAPDYVKPEELTAYEAGIKTRLFDGLVGINAAAFNYDIKNPQVQFISFLKGGVISFENAGSARIRGFEIDTVAQLLPSLTDGLVLTAAATALDPKYTRYEGGSGFNPTLGTLQGGFDFSGNQIVRSPKFSGTVGLSQTFSTSYGPIEVAGDYYRTSAIHFLAQNSDFGKQSGYGVFNARISYLYEPWALRFTVYGKNIANERYVNSIVPTDFGRNEARAQLSTYGMRLNWDF